MRPSQSADAVSILASRTFQSGRWEAGRGGIRGQRGGRAGPVAEQLDAEVEASPGVTATAGRNSQGNYTLTITGLK